AAAAQVAAPAHIPAPASAQPAAAPADWPGGAQRHEQPAPAAYPQAWNSPASAGYRPPHQITITPGVRSRPPESGGAASGVTGAAFPAGAPLSPYDADRRAHDAAVNSLHRRLAAEQQQWPAGGGAPRAADSPQSPGGWGGTGPQPYNPAVNSPPPWPQNSYGPPQ
ncbi:MAG: hypothetical protein KY476_22280, partial [Planctomycetes bacterium]|nr:hypothetical protein [Planctomycetota bacterium]